MEEFNFGTLNSCVKSNHVPFIHGSESSISSSSCSNLFSVDYSTSNSDNSSQQRNSASSVWPDYQLQSMCGSVDGSVSIWMDGISLDSMIKEDSADTVYQQEHACTVPDLQWSSMSHAGFLTDLVVDSERILNGSSCIDGLKYIQDSGIFLATGNTSNDPDIKEIKQPSSFPPIPFERTDSSPNTKAPWLTSSNSSVQNESGDAGKEKSFEATILQELIDVMQQMNQSTRIGFRDAFFNLAWNSKQQHATNQGSSKVITNVPPSATVHNELLSFANCILRATANTLKQQYRFAECRLGKMPSQELEAASINKTTTNPALTKPSFGIPGIACGALMDKEALKTTNNTYSLNQPMVVPSVSATKI